MTSRHNSIKDLILFYEKTYNSRPNSGGKAAATKEVAVNSSLYRKHSLHSNAVSLETKSDNKPSPALEASAIQCRLKYVHQTSMPVESTTKTSTGKIYHCFTTTNRAFSISPSTVSSSSSSSSSTSSVEKIAATAASTSPTSSSTSQQLEPQQQPQPKPQPAPTTLIAPHSQLKQAATLIVNEKNDAATEVPSASSASSTATSTSSSSTSFSSTLPYTASTPATKPTTATTTTTAATTTSSSINRRKHTSFYLPNNKYSFSVPPPKNHFHCPPRKSVGDAAAQVTPVASSTLSRNASLAERSSSRPHAPQPARFDPRNVQKVVLEWCQSRTVNYPNVKITNFSSSWSDGLAFAALIHSFMPETFDFNQLSSQNKRYNFEIAFETAFKHANVVPLLEVNDMLLMGNRPDEKCVFTYLSTIYTRFNSVSSSKSSSNSSNASSSSTSSSTSDIQ